MCRGIDVTLTGARLKKICEKKGLTAESICELLQLADTRSVYYWFSGRYIPDVNHLFMLASILEVPIDYILVPKQNTKSSDKDM